VSCAERRVAWNVLSLISGRFKAKICQAIRAKQSMISSQELQILIAISCNRESRRKQHIVPPDRNPSTPYHSIRNKEANTAPCRRTEIKLPIPLRTSRARIGTETPTRPPLETLNRRRTRVRPPLTHRVVQRQVCSSEVAAFHS